MTERVLGWLYNITVFKANHESLSYIFATYRASCKILKWRMSIKIVEDLGRGLILEAEESIVLLRMPDDTETGFVNFWSKL